METVFQDSGEIICHCVSEAAVEELDEYECCML